MIHPTKTLPTWTTASLGAHADTSPLELSALGEHLGRCQTGRGPLFALRCAADATHGLVAPRFVTTLVVVAALLAAAALLG
jgi:hypothetical protein